MRLSVPAIILSLCAVFTAASPVPEPLEPRALPPGFDPTKVTIEAIAYAGSGCKAGSVAISPNDEKTIITLGFDSFIANIGPNVPFGDRRRNCNINFRVKYPPGFSLILYQTDYYGYYSLEDKVEGHLQARYWFSGTPGPLRRICSWKGKKEDNYSCRDSLIGASLVLPPCGASTTMNINIEAILSNENKPDGRGTLSVDVAEQKVKTLLNFRWEKCRQ